MSDVDDDLPGQNQLLSIFFFLFCKSDVSVSEINTQNAVFCAINICIQKDAVRYLPVNYFFSFTSFSALIQSEDLNQNELLLVPDL